MSIPVQGRVTLKDNQALVVLNVATNNNQAEERPRSDLEALLNRAVRQEVPVRKKYVVQKEKGIKFGASGKWSDVEGDEATFDKRDVLSDAAWEHEVKADRSMLWEQWCGLVQRGKPQTLVLARLSPTLTATRSPGPGPITKQDWGPFGQEMVGQPLWDFSTLTRPRRTR